MKRKLISLILCIALMFTSLAIPMHAISKQEIVDKYDDGYQMIDLGNIIIGMRQIDKALYLLTGNPFYSEDNFNVIVDDTVQYCFDKVMEIAHVDASKLISNFPETNHISGKIVDTLEIDTVEMRSQLYAQADKYTADGNKFAGIMIKMFAAWLSVIEDCRISFVPEEDDPNLKRLYFTIDFRDGGSDSLKTGVFFHEDTHNITGPNNVDALLGFNMDVDSASIYTVVDSWQRAYGFCLAYDIFCYCTAFANYTTQRIKFDYQGEEWMIQLWKGRYLSTNGAEVGLYNRPMGSDGSFYDCAGDDDLLVMSLDLYHGSKLIAHRDPQPHWWLTSFAFSDTAYLPQTMTLVTTITMRDEEMFDAVTKSLDAKKALSYTVDGLDITITY
ncbi:MAG: DUF4474 domain-containing protein [Clostridia bacterium]|nr:DUF4474 domain-containing protein [Clostridia bacterium]